jgi:SAM-dependent methyltransferase
MPISEQLAAVCPPFPRESRVLDTSTFEDYRRITAGIDGWFSVGATAIWDALLAFQAEHGITGHLLEIGVWEGKSAALMAMHARPGTKLILADFKLKSAAIERALSSAGIAEGVEVVQLGGDSRALHIHPLVPECFQKVRWMHIDGEHSARAVSSDLALANQLLAPDGVLVVDDFFSWLYPQVTEAVLRYVRQFPDDFTLFLCGYNKAYLARTHFAHRYLAFCAEQLPEALTARGLETTVAKTTYPSEMNTFGVGPVFQDLTRRGPDWEPDTLRY